MFRLFPALLALALLMTGCGERTVAPGSDSNRIIALAPNVAEILFALDLGDQVVGVNRFTQYPPEATKKPVVGGLYDLNWEQIISLRPTLVIGLTSQKETASRFEALDIEFLGVSHERIDEIIQSIETIGTQCGSSEKARRLVAELRTKTEEVPQSALSRRPRVVVCVGHDDAMTRMYIASENTFYDDLIRFAGGINVCRQSFGAYPEFSPEGLRALQPDLIIDISVGGRPECTNTEHWKKFCERAVVLTNSYAAIPGPRYPLLLNDLTEAIDEIRHSN
jgi:iron complex transport system substrate-binding protein